MALHPNEIAENVPDDQVEAVINALRERAQGVTAMHGDEISHESLKHPLANAFVSKAKGLGQLGENLIEFLGREGISSTDEEAIRKEVLILLGTLGGVQQKLQKKS